MPIKKSVDEISNIFLLQRHFRRKVGGLVQIPLGATRPKNFLVKAL